MFLKIGHLQNPMDYHHVQYWPIFSHRNNLKNIRDHTRGSIPHFQTRQSFGRWNQDGGSIGSHPPWNKAKVSLWNLGPGFVESVISDFPSGKPTTWGISREYELCFILLGPTFRKVFVVKGLLDKFGRSCGCLPVDGLFYLMPFGGDTCLF